jgi:peptidoglycan-associated lipoprotein
MNWEKAVFSGSFAVSLLLIGGCKWLGLDSDPAPDEGQNVGAPIDKPLPPMIIDKDTEGTPEQYGLGADDKSLGHSAFGDLRVVKGPNFPVVYFGYDRSTISATARPKLDKVAAYLEKYPQLYLIIEGHCDERGTLEYNRALGERRAIGVKKYLETLGLSSERIKTVSFGEEMLEAPKAHSKNRRAVLLPAEKI